MKILVVEDDAETADYLVRGLTEAGHLVDRAPDGRDGLFLASGGGYDVLVVDRMLPGLDGLGLVRALRAAGVRTPALFLTARASSSESSAPAQLPRRARVKCPTLQQTQPLSLHLRARLRLSLSPY